MHAEMQQSGNSGYHENFRKLTFFLCTMTGSRLIQTIINLLVGFAILKTMRGLDQQIALP